MRDHDLPFVAHDLDEMNAKVLANLPKDRISEVFRIFHDLAEFEKFKPLRPAPRPAPVIVPVIKYPMSPRAKAALANISAVTAGRRYFREENEKLLNLAEIPLPREAGKAEVPIIVRDPKEVAAAKRLAKELHHIRDLEEALINAKARLAKLEKKSCVS